MTSAKLFAALALVPLVALVAGCGSSASKPTSTPAVAAKQACRYVPDGIAPARKVHYPPANPAKKLATSATISTNQGSIKLTLTGVRTPCTVNSFLSLARQHFFDNTRCHRLTITGFYLLQCGDPTATGSGGPGYLFRDELSGQETYGAGTVAMGNAGPDTNGSQFFLIYKDTQLSPQYTVFGHLYAAGLKVVQKIARNGIGPKIFAPGDGEPKKPVVIKSVTQG
ncbi:MAG: peptidylprolyl isomerase [Actinomycetota bacterium]|nr:peptidylprolyl isomerase [Actinomycetota bacterium]